jgi:hypothetical protein
VAKEQKAADQPGVIAQQAGRIEWFEARVCVQEILLPEKN